MPEFITHEVTHLWQKDIWPHLGEDQSWVHEGGADNLAHALMRLSGLFTAEGYRKKNEQVEYDCSNLLSRSSVTRGAENREYKIFYHCGNFVFNTIGAAINPEQSDEGVLSFWKTMAAWPNEARNTEESVELVFKTLTKLGMSEMKQSAIKEFLDTKPYNPLTAIADFKSVLLND